MLRRTEISLSRDLVLRAEKRLSYQATSVSQLELGRDIGYENTVRGLHSIMRNKLERLVRQHDVLLAKTLEG